MCGRQMTICDVETVQCCRWHLQFIIGSCLNQSWSLAVSSVWLSEPFIASRILYACWSEVAYNITDPFECNITKNIHTSVVLTVIIYLLVIKEQALFPVLNLIDLLRSDRIFKFFNAFNVHLFVYIF